MPEDTLIKCEACNGLGDVDAAPPSSDDDHIVRCEFCDGTGRTTWERLDKWRWGR